MRWIALWLTVTLVAVTSGHNLSKDIHQQINTSNIVVVETPEIREQDNLTNEAHNDDDQDTKDEAESSSSEQNKSDTINGDGSNESNSVNDENGEVVNTTHGPVQGLYLHGDLGIQSFFDIPYGEFDGLFKAPREPEPWTDIRDNKDHNVLCPQLRSLNDIVTETKCLTLSVFVPKDAKNCSVLFHIYDSDFTTGSANPSIYGPEYLAKNNIIVILPNYRLGPLGFLCAQTEDVPGNAALKDLTLALDWTRRNIEFFHGNPDNIIVSGDGTSGALVGYLALSKASKKYIKGAIVESGSVLADWAIDRDPIATATRLAEKIQGNTRTDTNLLDVFKTVDVNLLLRRAENERFKPCVETGADSFINTTAWNMLDEEELYIPFMIGSANHAGMVEALAETQETVAKLRNNNSLFLPTDLKFDTSRQMEEVGERVKSQYFVGCVCVDSRKNFTLWHTDALYLGPTVRTARAFADAGANVYLYEFSYRGNLNWNKDPDNMGGATRGDMAGYVFHQEERHLEATDSDKKMVDLMVELWVGFVEKGQPPEHMGWPELKRGDDTDEEWMSIDSVVKQENGLHLDRMRLWTEIYEKYFIERNNGSRFTQPFGLVFVLLGLYKAHQLN